MNFNFWPGGIPHYIRPDPTPIEYDNVAEEVKGWELFLEENWVTPDATNAAVSSKIQQRRMLVEKWALATQELRNSYQTRAPPCRKLTWKKEDAKAEARRRKYHDNNNNDHGVYCFCLCTASLESPRNRALWTKIRILFHDLSGSIEATISPGDFVNAIPNPASKVLLSHKDILMWRYVESADFAAFSMTSTGTVVFTMCHDTLIVDQQALNTGHLLFCHFDLTGNVQESVLMWPMDIRNEWPHIQGSCLGPSSFADTYMWKNTSRRPPLKMELPILELLDDPDIEFWLSFEGAPDTWAEDIEIYAPGYIKMEEDGNGMASDYDHSNFKETFNL